MMKMLLRFVEDEGEGEVWLSEMAWDCLVDGVGNLEVAKCGFWENCSTG